MHNPDVTVRSRGRDGEVHVLRAAHQRRRKIEADRRTGPRPARRRGRDRLPGRPARPRRSSSATSTTRTAGSAKLQGASRRNYGAAGRAEHPAAHDVPGGVRNPNRHAGRRTRARDETDLRRRTMTSSEPHPDGEAAPTPGAELAHRESPSSSPGTTFATVTDKISAIVLTRQDAARLVRRLRDRLPARCMLLFVAIAYLLFRGIGIWGINIPVGWGFDIVNFVWWIGIGHAGTLISAILLLLRQKWRTSHQPLRRGDDAVRGRLRRPCSRSCTWAGPWLLLLAASRIPNTMGLWPQFRSPLVWDVFAVSTYATVSLLFWYVGLIPDLATLRDRAHEPRGPRSIYGILAMGWRGSAHALAPLRDGLPAAGRPGDAAGRLGAHRRELRLRRRASSPAGTRRSSRRTSSPAPSSPASPWC